MGLRKPRKNYLGRLIWSLKRRKPIIFIRYLRIIQARKHRKRRRHNLFYHRFQILYTEYKSPAFSSSPIRIYDPSSILHLNSLRIIPLPLKLHRNNRQWTKIHIHRTVLYRSIRLNLSNSLRNRAKMVIIDQ